MNTNDGTFTLLNVPIYPGTNLLEVTVTDVSGNYSPTNWLVVKDCEEVFAYDNNGNLVTNSTPTATNVYEWDPADRLTKVTSNGVVVLENWYDASSRRIAKEEVVNGQTIYSLYVWDGWASAAVLNESAQTLETFTRGQGLSADIAGLVAVTHHAASITNGTFYVHHNHRGDIVLTRSGTMTVGSYSYSAFGLQTSAFGPDVCRFKFSSKERDAATGFSYYGYRFYVPGWQRWLNRDPIAEGGGHNLYAFVGNNPVIRIDPLGEASWCAEHYTDRRAFEQEPDVFDVGSVHYDLSTRSVPSLSRCVQRPRPSRLPATVFASAAHGRFSSSAHRRQSRKTLTRRQFFSSVCNASGRSALAPSTMLRASSTP